MSDSIARRYTELVARIAAACGRARRPPKSVRLVAVTKDVSAARVREAFAAGVRCFGENYVQEWRAKQAELADVAGIEWHFIGRLQRNKASLAAASALIHSLSDERVAEVLDREGARRETPIRTLIQVNVAGELSKGGVSPAELPDLLAALRHLRWLRVEGLMTVPPLVPAPAVRPFFRTLRTLRDALERPAELRELSMGMSADFEIAIEEGSTLVRVGTAIFGARKEAR